MQKNDLPIGVFDSGLGGLTAVREIKKILPREHVLYFGDTGRLPYGTRSPEIIKKYACDDMNFLLTNSVKAVLVACGTVSSTALDVLKANFDIPVIGVVEPASAAACALSRTGRIALLATPSTVRAGAFETAVRALRPEAKVLGIGCPMFVPLVENGYIARDCAVTRQIAAEYIAGLTDFAPDVIILGCTHYPLIKDIVADCAAELLGSPVVIVDSGSAAADAMKNYLDTAGLARRSSPGTAHYFVSDQPYDFGAIASRFLGESVNDVTKIDIENYLYQPHPSCS